MGRRDDEESFCSRLAAERADDRRDCLHTAQELAARIAHLAEASAQTRFDQKKKQRGF